MIENKSINNHSSYEINVCNLLNLNGVTTSVFVQNMFGETISCLNKNISFHVQKFVEGKSWEKNSAPDWLVDESISYISKVHTVLNKVVLPERKSICLINDRKFHLNSIEALKHKANSINDASRSKMIIQMLELRSNLINKLPSIDLDKLTQVNGHGDYSITQIITKNKNIRCVIDFTETSNIPVIWDLSRFFFNSIPLENASIPPIKYLKDIIYDYSYLSNINEYDKSILWSFNTLYMAQALQVFGKFFEEQSEKYWNKIIERQNKLIDLYNSYFN